MVMLYKIALRISRLDGTIYLQLTYKQILVIFRNQVIKEQVLTTHIINTEHRLGKNRRTIIGNCWFEANARLMRGSVTALAACRSYVAPPRSTKLHLKEVSDVKDKIRV